MAISFEDNEKLRIGALMAIKSSGEEVEIEVKVEHTTEKAYLIEETMSGKKVWMPKSQSRIVREADEDGNWVFAVTEWWFRKSGL